MESWNQIIHTALLGTDKKQLKKEELPEELAESFELVKQFTTDREDSFLQSAALLFNFRQCGVSPLHKESISIHTAEPEDKTYANQPAHLVLHDIISIESITLIKFWLEQCMLKQKIVQPEFIPILMDTGISHKELRDSVFTCCGKRGEWLAGFNENWKPALPITEEELWQTGTLEQRKKLLFDTRTKNPAKARQMLQEVWAQESAATKTELLKQLSTNQSEEDIEWLEQLQAEKSQKVKDVAIEILKTIPSSPIVLKYIEILKASIKLIDSKGLLGIGNKSALEIKLINTIDDSVFKSGIEKLSSDKKVSDEDYIVYQLISSVPPSFWEEYFIMDIDRILKLFSKNDRLKYFIYAFGLAASKFRNKTWIRAIIEILNNEWPIYVFELLPQEEAEVYAIRYFHYNENAAIVIHQLKQYNKEWSPPLAIAVLKHTGSLPYQYNKAFYNEIIHLLPVSIAEELEKFAPKEEHMISMWKNLSDHISKLLSLKLQTLKAFNE